MYPTFQNNLQMKAYFKLIGITSIYGILEYYGFVFRGTGTYWHTKYPVGITFGRCFGSPDDYCEFEVFFNDKSERLWLLKKKHSFRPVINYIVGLLNKCEQNLDTYTN